MRDLHPAPGLPPGTYVWHSGFLAHHGPNPGKNPASEDAATTLTLATTDCTDTVQPLLLPQTEDSPLPLLLCLLAPDSDLG